MTYTKADLLAKVTEFIADGQQIISPGEAALLGKPVGFVPVGYFGTIHGIRADEFIEQLCAHLGIIYSGKFGRLSQLRKELSDE
jgi:hypothetical protein